MSGAASGVTNNVMSGVTMGTRVTWAAIGHLGGGWRYR
jgi:hypothetical protein